MRGLAILVGVELIERFHWVIYVLGATLLFLAWRILRGVARGHRPGPGPHRARGAPRAARSASDYHGPRFFAREDGRRVATPMVLALVGVVAADIAFAVDSIPAAFAITTDAFAIWAANAFALLGPARAVLAGRGADPALPLPRRDDRRRAGIVAVKLLIEDLYKVGPIVSLLLVLGSFARRDRRLDPRRPPRPRGRRSAARARGRGARPAVSDPAARRARVARTAGGEVVSAREPRRARRAGRQRLKARRRVLVAVPQAASNWTLASRRCAP